MYDQRADFELGKYPNPVCKRCGKLKIQGAQNPCDCPEEQADVPISIFGKKSKK